MLKRFSEFRIPSVNLFAFYRIVTLVWVLIIIRDMPAFLQYGELPFLFTEVGTGNLALAPFKLWYVLRDAALGLTIFMIVTSPSRVFTAILSLILFVMVSAFFTQTGITHRLQVIWFLSLSLSLVNWKNPSQKQFVNFIIFVRIIYVSVFFSAALTKILTSGVHWFDPETIRTWMLYNKIFFYRDLPFKKEIVTWIFEWDAIPTAMALCAFVLEILSPLAIFNRRAKNIIIPCLFVFQFLAYYILNPLFWEFIILYFFWISPKRIEGFLNKIGVRVESPAFNI